MLRVAVTRPLEQLADLSTRAASCGIEILPFPLTQVRAIPFSWPDGLAMAQVDWLFFTSSQGVTAFFSGLRTLNLKLTSRTRTGAVGDKTATVLSKLSHTDPFIPSEAYGHNLFEEFAARSDCTGQTVVYARAETVNYDPAELLSARGVNYFPIVVYKTTEIEIDTAKVSTLCEKDYILFTAPSTVDAYESQFGRPAAMPIALGRTTAAQMAQHGWKNIAMLPSPNLDHILEFSR